MLRYGDVCVHVAQVCVCVVDGQSLLFPAIVRGHVISSDACASQTGQPSQRLHENGGNDENRLMSVEVIVCNISVVF